MSILVVGLSHKSAPVATLEESTTVAASPPRMPDKAALALFSKSEALPL